MDKGKEYNDLLDILFLRAEKNYRTTKEYGYQEEREKDLKEFLQSNLTPSEKPIVEEILCKLQDDAAHRKYRFYQQGFYDCFWLLKNIFYLGRVSF